ncbi:hypothetical protein FA95DRAFT_1122796 [Auriscalpium vulgare]|uniref:Uncharacterized protein n=1 Tax=Auriscalpium vulgare TaxID=40419 RepID=A0ACB8R5B0_9AGAM|nr:hypothetical protein FA95DRAFT_1122796 [Auriscalpium vulgare]
MAGELPRISRKYMKDPYSLANPIFFRSVQWAGPPASQYLVPYTLSSGDAGAPAIVSVVGEISHKNYRLFLGGNWSAFSGQSFADVTSTALLQRPRNVHFHDQWDTVIANGQAIAESAVGDNALVKVAVRPVIDHVSCASGSALEIGHKFLRLDHVDDGEDEFPNVPLIGQAELSAEKRLTYDFNGWPRKTADIAKAALEVVRGYEHVPRLLPVFTQVNPHPIPPNDYNDRLRGALVLVKLIFKHTSTPFSTQGPAAHAFTAEIKDMRILQEARYDKYTSRVSYLGPWDDEDDEAY